MQLPINKDGNIELLSSPIIFCTNEPNDADLVRALGSMVVPVPLPCGDVLFYGINNDDKPVKVIIERKHVPDMVSCILSGRYLSQAQSAKDDNADVLVLIIDGRYRASPADGLLEILGFDRERNRAGWKPVTPAITFSRFDQYLTELEYLAGIIVKHSETVQGTADIVKTLWSNFQIRPRDHQSLKVIYKPPPATILLTKPGIVRRVATELPSVGWGRSGVVAEHFPTVKAMVDADVAEWASLEGIGKKTAERVVKALRGNI